MKNVRIVDTYIVVMNASFMKLHRVVNGNFFVEDANGVLSTISKEEGLKLIGD